MSASASESTPRIHKHQKRIYAKACQTCRSRKVKCEGAENPPCAQCRAGSFICEVSEPARSAKRARNSATHFDDVPSERHPSHTPLFAGTHERESSAAIHAELERRIRRLEAKLDVYSRSSSVSVDERDETPGEHRAHHDRHHRQRGEGQAVPKSELDQPRYVLGPLGRPVYHGETSMHDDYPPTAGDGVGSLGGMVLEHITSNTRLRAALRAQHIYTTQDEGERCLEAHLCWAGHHYCVIYRPLFLRDMATNGPYFSQLLLLAAYISGLRFTASLDETDREARAQRFYDQFMVLLMEEMRKPTSIVTIQALLVLSGRQCAVGKVSEAWLYTGMAIRMMQDMGIHLPLDDASSARLSAEEREIRTRVYWSAYTWDKTLALTLGREPTLIYRAGHSPDKILDETDDTTIWTPYTPGWEMPIPEYPPCQYQSTRVMRYSCRLNMILESVLMNMYSPERPNARSLSFVRSARDRLDEWWKDLPLDLRIHRPDLPALSPPGNIVLINLLYQVLRILLYRTLLTSPNQPQAVTASSLDICRAAATSIHDILGLWTRTFGTVNMVYLMMYSTFVAAGVDVILLRVGNAAVREEALGRVHRGLQVLEVASSQGPGIRQGIATIRSQLERATRGEFATPLASARTPSSVWAKPSRLKQVLSSQLALATPPTSSGHPDIDIDGKPHDTSFGQETLFPASAPSALTPGAGPDFLDFLNIAQTPGLDALTAAAANDASNRDASPVTNGDGRVGQLAVGNQGIMSHAVGLGDDAGVVSSTATGLEGYWLNPQNLLDLLAEAPITSDDPFAFGVSGDWSGWSM